MAKKIIDEKELDLENDILYTRFLYVGKLGYQNQFGDYHECDSDLVVGVHNYEEKSFEDVLNFKKYAVRRLDNILPKSEVYSVDELIPLKEFMKEKGLEVKEEITRKELREIIAPLEVKDPILRRVVNIFKKVDDSNLGTEANTFLKANLERVMDKYLEDISKGKNDLMIPAEIKYNANLSLSAIEDMIPSKNIDEVKEEGKKVKEMLFRK